ncbi:uncharacterized protein F4822DRAFT_425524 [Hypoxylon trugodes]|uniref:uncharacterized protein n=1 Tax=Hypoxylon trugodes TaxID=326681 RepID=UPI0021910E45|nr:uncharacterized protein F4822DRAFT_425524 [Hypoxylon trugodes]KAI1392315.1 hypothetical protein F4822DRAFT_425524 [Hypoxylon trugodes]
MRRIKLFLALTSLYPLVSASSDYQHSTTDLEPLQPWETNITNPNSFPAGPGVSFDASEANCTFEWEYWGTNGPYGQAFGCITTEESQSSSSFSGSSSTSRWTIEISEASGNWTSPTENVDVKFTLTSNLTVDVNEYYKVLAGTHHFEVGKNMVGSCGGSGVCSWYLDNKNGPALIHPTIMACEGAC